MNQNQTALEFSVKLTDQAWYSVLQHIANAQSTYAASAPLIEAIQKQLQEQAEAMKKAATS